jgi:hypothetical protein
MVAGRSDDQPAVRFQRPLHWQGALGRPLPLTLHALSHGSAEDGGPLDAIGPLNRHHTIRVHHLHATWLCVCAQLCNCIQLDIPRQGFSTARGNKTSTTQPSTVGSTAPRNSQVHYVCRSTVYLPGQPFPSAHRTNSSILSAEGGPVHRTRRCALTAANTVMVRVGGGIRTPGAGAQAAAAHEGESTPFLRPPPHHPCAAFRTGRRSASGVHGEDFQASETCVAQPL